MRRVFSAFAGIAILSGLLAGTASAPAQAEANYDYWNGTVIYVQDDTANIRMADGSPRWPVHAAAEKWDNNNPINFIYVTTGCPQDSQCVTVREGNASGNSAGEETSWTVGQVITSADVTLDRSYGRDFGYSYRRNTVCHELGHALGLGHSSTPGSCMYDTATPTRYPSSTDVSDLNIMY